MTKQRRPCRRPSLQGNGVCEMSNFELSNAITLFSQEKIAITHLWTVYVVATFAAAGFGFAGAPLNALTATAVTIGFSVFAFGNWKLLKQSLVISRVLRQDILAAIAADSDPAFKSSIEALVDRANPPWISFCIHLFIDTCVFVALWTRVPQVSQKLFGPLPASPQIRTVKRVFLRRRR
jgi:hypothetical protein